jgi:hypothetical protein
LGAPGGGGDMTAVNTTSEATAEATAETAAEATVASVIDHEIDDPRESAIDGVQPAPATRARRFSVPAWWPFITLGSAVALWVVSILQVDANKVGELGLISAMPPTYFAAIAVVILGVAFAIHRGARIPVVLAHATVFVLLVHATPEIVYGTLRYSWAWKHIGIIDLMQRRHMLVPGTPVLPIYQDWPGFFAAATTLTEAGGLRSALPFAGWAPPVFELLEAAALVVVFRGLTDDRRRIALAVWFFLIANWVGQDYFAPQAFDFFLYLVVLAIVLRWYRRRAEPPKWLRRALRFKDAEVHEPFAPDLSASQKRTTVFVLLALMAAIATSHPLTPLVLTAVLWGLSVCRVLKRRWPAIAMIVVTFGWLVTGAQAYTFGNFSAMLSGFGQLGSNVNSNLANLGALSKSQQLVANMGRLVVVSILLLAVAGFLRRFRRGHFDLEVALLCLAPAAILAGGSYGGEAIFRVYLFALPFAAFMAAGWFFTTKQTITSWRTPVAVVAVSGVLIGGFLFAYLGKEAWSRFTTGEVRAASIVFDHAPRNSLLVDGTLSYPTQFANVERFTYTTIGNEPPQSVKQVLRDPVTVLHSWLADTRYAQGYLIITQSQKNEANATGLMPRGSLDRIEHTLLASHQFHVLYHDRNATVFTVDRPTANSGLTP